MHRGEVAGANQTETQCEDDARAARRYQDAIYRGDAAADLRVAEKRLISESQKKVKAEEDFAHELGSAEGHPLKRMRALLADLLICN